MAFGQQSGPPATRQQLSQLLELLNNAGHSDFRDARGPMGFTQRQAGGKFTTAEADAFIEQLLATEHGQGDTPPEPKPRVTAAEQKLRNVPAEQLATELQRRGWVVMEP